MTRRRLLTKGDPMGGDRHPLVVYFLLIVLVSGLGMATGHTTAGSLDEALPDYLAEAWGYVLVFGSGIMLVGMFWQWDVRDGLVMKRTGALALALASFAYTAVLLHTFGQKAFFVSGLTAGFGIACALQFCRVNKRIKQIILETREEDDGDE